MQDQDDTLPLVTIGMPVFNGEKYIRKSLDALLEQDYKNFELIISDNASTDATYDICLEYKKKDHRILIVRKEKNKGAVANFSDVRNYAKGEYFMWASHDDIFLPGFIGGCVQRMQEDNNIQFCYPSLRFIDEKGECMESYTAIYDNRDLSSENDVARLTKWWSLSGWYAIYGLYRTDAIKKVILKDLYGFDVIFITDFLLKGYRGGKIDEPLFHYRQYQNKTEIDRYEASVMKRKKLLCPHINLYYSLFQSILFSELSVRLKLSAIRSLPKALYPKVKGHLRAGVFHSLKKGNVIEVIKLLFFIPSVISRKAQ